MSVQYHIYRNSMAAGPVDYSTPVATVSGLTWASSALATPSDNRFAVRAFDTVSSLEESNIDAVVRIRIDASGADLSGLPNAPGSLSVRATANGGARVTWFYAVGNQGGPPTGFKVWLTAGSTVNYAASPTATIPYFAGLTTFSADLSGLTDAAAYVVGVQSYNASGTETNTAKVSIVGDATGPDAVDDLVATATA